MGFPDAEGYFLRCLRERGTGNSPVAAARLLGRSGGKRSIDPLTGCLTGGELSQAAADAMADIGSPEAAAALLAKADREEAFLALARLAPASAHDLFRKKLEEPAPLNTAAARALGRIGKAEDAALLLPLIASADRELARAAFEGYAAMGAPEGLEPLAKAAAEGVEPWMVGPLAALDSPEARAILFTGLGPRPLKGLWKKLAFWKRAPRADLPDLYRALAGAGEGEIVAELARRLHAGMDPTEMKALLGNECIASDPKAREELARMARGRDLVAAYRAFAAWGACPDAGYFPEAMRLFRIAGFLEMDQASAVEDEERMLEAAAHESSPCLLVGGLLESTVLDLAPLVESLRKRLHAGNFAAEGRPEPLAGAGGGNLAPFLDAFDDAYPAMKEALPRLWRLLNETTEGGFPLFELLWCHTGLHRGGIQRMAYRRMDDALDRWTAGKDDTFLPEVEKAQGHVPREGELRGPLLALFQKARARLMAECKDLVVWVEGGQRGDIVLVEKL